MGVTATLKGDTVMTKPGKNKVLGWRGVTTGVAVAALGAALLPAAHAGVLQFSYSEPSTGVSFTFDQQSNPTPLSYDSGIGTQVAITNWSGTAGPTSYGGPFTSMEWYSASAEGGFAPPAGPIDVYGPQIYTGTEANPIFIPGTYKSLYETYGSECDSYTAWGTLTITALNSVPEPGSLALFAATLGLLGGAVFLRRRAQASRA